jgi:hypothetical protein
VGEGVFVGGGGVSLGMVGAVVDVRVAASPGGVAVSAWGVTAIVSDGIVITLGVEEIGALQARIAPNKATKKRMKRL